MNITALLYLEDGVKDDDLMFRGAFLPDELSKRLASCNNITSIKISVPENYSSEYHSEKIGIDAIKRKDKDDISFWKKIFSVLNADHIIKIFCDSPFIDMDIIAEMIDVHTKYLAEFTYSENLPSGYSCEIISRELVNAIPEPEEKTLPIGQVIRSNINKFDVELYYKEPDVRDKRLSFRCGNPREKRIMERIYDISGSFPKYGQIKEIIDNNPGVLFIGPSYLDIELTGRCNLDCIFCYRKILKKTRPDMEPSLFKKTLKDMEDFSLPYSICLGGSGEPLLNRNFYEILDLAKEARQIENIVIETNGTLADINFKYYIVNNKDDRFKIIFNVNGMDENSYKSIHKENYFNKVFDNIRSIREAVSLNDAIYIQIMKINETEIFLDKYYDYWEKVKIPIILQKQNTYIGRITDKAYSDLTPLERTPCWHLQRDLNILSDGTALFCKQDIDGENSPGNVQKESIKKIFEKSQDDFLNDYRKNFRKNPDCASCNEWYTFNL